MAGIDEGEFDSDDDMKFTFVNHGTTLQMDKHGKLPKTWILLDNQSTVDVFCNEELLTDIRIGTGTMDIHCNAGVTSTNLIGELPGYGTVWLHRGGIANILSLSRMTEQGYHVTYDSKGGNQFKVMKSDGTCRIFKESDRGLFYLDTATNKVKDESDVAGDDEESGVALINTVDDNRSKYTKRAYLRAEHAPKIQHVIGHPCTKEYIQIVERNLLPNCPITRDDIMAAERIFGPDVGILKGKTVQKGSKHVDPNMSDVNIPSDILIQYRNVTVGGDIMFINKLPFFVTISRNLKFSTAELMLNQKHHTIVEHIKRVQWISYHDNVDGWPISWDSRRAS